ncbi:MAG: hypothetical protein IT371_13845 [Deltaproteobacteria bacterium]|nr:hypothetical protein [Deltaproteobacteria bacterium]
MNRTTSKAGTPDRSGADLEATCRLWMAAAQARDERVAELEAECAQLRQRVARLSRLVNRNQRVRRPEALRSAK